MSLIDKLTNEKAFYDITSEGSILITVNMDSEITECQKRQLAGIQFKFFVKQTDDNIVKYIPITKQNYVWSMGQDSAMLIHDIPTSCTLMVNPIINIYAKEVNEKLENENDALHSLFNEYLKEYEYGTFEMVDEFDISVDVDTSSTPSPSGGSEIKQDENGIYYFEYSGNDEEDNDAK